MSPGLSTVADSLPAHELDQDTSGIEEAERKLQELLVGVWAYGTKKAYTYEVEYPGELVALGTPASCLRFHQRLTKGSLSGVLEPRAASDGPGDDWTSWMEAELHGANGEPRGRIRLRPLKGRGAVVSSFMSPNGGQWGGETTAHGVPRPYYVDNSFLPRTAAIPPGLDYHLSQDLEDKEGTQAAWGSTVVGVDLGDGWLRVADGQPGKQRYLPVRIGNIRVLTATEREWQCKPRTGAAVGVRLHPYFDGPLTGEEIRVGDKFKTTSEYKGADAILHLKLADRRGWVPARHAYAGQLCEPCPDRHRPAPSRERRGQLEAAAATEARVMELLTVPQKELPSVPRQEAQQEAQWEAPGPVAAPPPPAPAPAPAPPPAERPPPGKALGSSIGVIAAFSTKTGIGFVMPDDQREAEVYFGKEHLTGIAPAECRSGLRVTFDKFDVAGKLRARNVCRADAGANPPEAEAPAPQSADEQASRPSAFDFEANLSATIADLAQGEKVAEAADGSGAPSGDAVADAEDADMAARAVAALEPEAPPSPPVYLDRAEVLGFMASNGVKAGSGQQGVAPGSSADGSAASEAMLASSAAPFEALSLRVHGLGGPLCVIKAHRGWALREAKAAIEAQVKIPRSEQRLLCEALEPREADLLSCLPPGDSVDMVLVRRRPEEAEWVAAAEESWHAVEKAPEWVRSSHELMYAVVQQAGYTLRFASDELRQDRSVVLAAVGQNGHSITSAASELRTDPEVVMAALRQSGLALQAVARDFGAAKEVVLVAVKQNGLAIEHAAAELKSDLEVASAAVQQTGLALQYVSLKLRAESEVVLAAVQQNGLALRFAPQELRADAQVVRAAVLQNGLALEFARQELRANHEVALAAVRQHKRAIELVATKLRADRSFILAAVQENGLVLQHAAQALRSSSEIALAAVKQNGLALQFSAQERRAARGIVLAAVKQNGLALQFASQELRKDLRVVLTAVQQDEGALRFASTKLEGTEKDLAKWRDGSAVRSPDEAEE